MNISIIGNGIMGNIFASALKEHYNIKTYGRNDNKESCGEADFIILAVKPQDFSLLVEEMPDNLNKNTIIISVMTGISLDRIKHDLGVEKVIRMVPNLGAKVGKSITAWTASTEVDQTIKEEVKKMLEFIGKELYIQDEVMINKATAVSGSGPGFFYYVIGEWLQAVEEFGFSAEEAQKLLFTTLDGANTILQQERNHVNLTKQVTSKGGTTEAGLKILNDAHLLKLWKNTLQAAWQRANELQADNI